MPFPASCPVCHFDRFSKYDTYKKTVINLKFLNSGVTKWIVQYKGGRIRCQHCGNIFRPDEFKNLRKYGRNLMVWTVNQYIACQTTGEKIVETLSEQFNIRLPIDTVFKFKSEFSKVYKQTVEEIKRTMLDGYLIHVDETKVSRLFRNSRGTPQHVVS